MNLQNIETQVLALIDYDRYADLSVDTATEKAADFALLHQCVNLARDEMKFNCSLPELYTVGTVIPSVASQAAYSMATDFDVPVKMFYLDTSGNIIELSQISVENLGSLVLATSTGTPSSYLMAGTSGNLIRVYLSPIPANSGESLLPVYKPVLTSLTTNTDEDILMRKYPKTIINFTTAFAFQIIKRDQTGYDKYYAYGINDCRQINLRQSSFDANSSLSAETLLSKRRQDRLTI